MTENNISSIAGELIQDKDFAQWHESASYPIPFFNGKKLPIIFMDNEDEKFFSDADEAMKHFLSLGTVERLNISPLVYKNWTDFIDNAGDLEDNNKFRNPGSDNEVWQFVHPSKIILSRRPYNDQDIYVQIECECEWEEEHGLQLIFRQGKKLTRVSQYDGHLTEADAYDKPDEEDELLSKF